jgi:tRNA(Arg) A34 adenosine deaminase TadA
MSPHEKFMAQAIALSRESMLAKGDAPFAAVIVRDGEVVGEGVNQVRSRHDATSHGEVEAIRDAGRRLGTWDLSGCEIYTTCEPCEMCVAAMFWANIKTMYYANTLQDCEALGFELEPLRTLVRSDLHRRAIVCERVMPEEARAVFDEWAKQPTFESWP